MDDTKTYSPSKESALKSIDNVCGSTDRLTLMLRGMETVRHHTSGKMVEKQSIGEHVANALVFLLYLWPDASRELIISLIFHDAGECYTGDAPGTIKGEYPSLSSMYNRLELMFHSALDIPHSSALSSQDKIRLKVVDALELYYSSLRQNDISYNAGVIARRALTYVRSYRDQLTSDEERDRVNKVMSDISCRKYFW